MRIPRKWLFVGSLLLLFITVRLLFIFTSPLAYFEEERHAATIGQDILEGRLRLPFWYYLDSPHSGGSLFAGLLAIPFYIIFGKNYLALKLAALFLNLATFIFLIFVLTKRYDQRIFLPLTVLFVISTPGYLYHSLIFIGNIEPSLIFISLLNLFLLSLYIKDETKSKLYPLGIGFLSGLGLWMQYGQVIVITEILLLLFLLDRRFYLRRDFLYFLISFFVGFSPFIIYNISYNFVSFTSDPTLLDYNFFLTELNFGGIVERLSLLLIFELPKAFQIPSILSLSPELLRNIFYAVILFFIGVALWTENWQKKLTWTKLSAVYLILAVLYTSILSVPRGGINDRGVVYAHGYYHLTFFQPYLFLLASIGVAKLLKRKSRWKKVICWIGLALVFVIVTASFSQIVPLDNFNHFLMKPVGKIEANAFETGCCFSRNINLFNRELDKLSNPDLRLRFIMGAAQCWNFVLIREKLDQEKLQKLLLEISRDEKIFFFKELVKGSINLGPTQESVLENYDLVYPLLSPSDQEFLEIGTSQALEYLESVIAK